MAFAEEESFAPPQVLFEEGDVDAGDIFIVLEGRASVVVRGQLRNASGTCRGGRRTTGTLVLVEAADKRQTRESVRIWDSRPVKVRTVEFRHYHLG